MKAQSTRQGQLSSPFMPNQPSPDSLVHDGLNVKSSTPLTELPNMHNFYNNQQHFNAADLVSRVAVSHNSPMVGVSTFMISYGMALERGGCP